MKHGHSVAVVGIYRTSILTKWSKADLPGWPMSGNFIKLAKRSGAIEGHVKKKLGSLYVHDMTASMMVVGCLVIGNTTASSSAA